MVKVATNMLTVLLTLAIGKMTNSMVKGWKHGQMVLGTKDSTSKARSMAKGLSHLLTAVSIQVISSRMRFLVKEGTCGQMERLMKETGKGIKCMGMGSSSGKTASVMKETL